MKRILLALVVILRTASAATPATCEAITYENALRTQFAIKVVDPSYPADAIRTKVTGLAVADICITAGSHVAVVLSAIAPSESIRQAMKDALAGWRFKSPETMYGRGGPASYGGKIVYYFVGEPKKWTVLSPEQSFFVGPKFALSSTGK